MNHDGYILIVDDNEDDIALTLRALKREQPDNHFVVACDGQEALDYLFSEGEYTEKENALPVVVLLDLSMPRMGGLDVLKRLRSDPRTEFLPVVMLTSSDEQKDIMESYRSGANSYVRKPVEVEHFSKAIRELQQYWTTRNTWPPRV